MVDPVRLSKHVAEMVPCSRREAEQYIEGGWVSVDGSVMEKPHYKVTNEKVEIDPNATLESLEPVTLLVNKPVGYDVTSDDHSELLTAESHDADDPEARRILYRHFRNLTVTTWLDTNASGLLVFTQDRGVENKLIKNTARIQQEYAVEVSGEIAPYGLKKLQKGMSFEGNMLPAAQVSWQSENVLRFASNGVRLGQIEFMCKEVGLTVVAMRRIRIGSVSMGKIPVGQWRYLHPKKKF